jgi:hypothetical protein
LQLLQICILFIRLLLIYIDYLSSEYFSQFDITVQYIGNKKHGNNFHLLVIAKSVRTEAIQTVESLKEHLLLFYLRFTVCFK